MDGRLLGNERRGLDSGIKQCRGCRRLFHTGDACLCLSGIGCNGVVDGLEGVIGRVIGDTRGVESVAAGVVDGNVGTALGVEVDGGDVAEPPKGISDGCHENLPEGLLVLKLNLGLRGVDMK